MPTFHGHFASDLPQMFEINRGRLSIPRLSEKSSQDEIEKRQRKQSPEEGKCKEMPKTGQRKTTGDRPMYKRPNDRSMQGSTGMPRPRFNQSGIRHSLRYGAAPKAQDEIEERQRKQSPEEGQCKEMAKKDQRKTTDDSQCHKNPVQANAKQSPLKTRQNGAPQT